MSAYEAQGATTGRLTPGTGGSEGPPASGPENAYKPTWCPTHRTWVDGGNLRCAACGEYHLKFAGGAR